MRTVHVISLNNFSGIHRASLQCEPGGFFLYMGDFMETEVKLKEPKTFEEQLKILEDRKMIIENREEALNVLSLTNYYRLTAYVLQFKVNDNYGNRVSFNNMYKLYRFDKKLRNLILEVLESIEIALKTYMAYTLSIKYGSEAYKDSNIFKDTRLHSGYDEVDGTHHKGLLEEIGQEIRKNRKEPLVKHHIRKYKSHFPTWAIVELLSFGMISRMYSNLNTADQKIIAREGFKTNNVLLESWVINFAYIRNICAHYGRLYNKRLDINPKLHSKYSKDNLDPTRIFVSILAIKELTVNGSEWTEFKSQLELLIDEYINDIDLRLIGFPQNWREILKK